MAMGEAPCWARFHKNRASYWVAYYAHRPSWYDSAAVTAIYREAKRRRDEGEDVVVDHIVPLNGATVCGLHVAENLQIIHPVENARKRHWFWPGGPEQGDLFRG